MRHETMLKYLYKEVNHLEKKESKKKNSKK